MGAPSSAAEFVYARLGSTPPPGARGSSGGRDVRFTVRRQGRDGRGPALVMLVLLMVSASVAAAVPGTVTGISSSTTSETTWYSAKRSELRLGAGARRRRRDLRLPLVLDPEYLDHPGHDERP